MASWRNEHRFWNQVGLRHQVVQICLCRTLRPEHHTATMNRLVDPCLRIRCLVGVLLCSGRQKALSSLLVLKLDLFQRRQALLMNRVYSCWSPCVTDPTVEKIWNHLFRSSLRFYNPLILLGVMIITAKAISESRFLFSVSWCATVNIMLDCRFSSATLLTALLNCIILSRWDIDHDRILFHD